MADSARPEVCPRCGSRRVARILWDKFFSLSTSDRAQVDAGRTILGRSGPLFDRADPNFLPDWGCLDCVPLWADVHRLALQVLERQEAKEAAVRDHNFELAARLRGQQERLEPERAALVGRIRRCLSAQPMVGWLPAQWRTSDVVGLARGIDADRAFDRLPLLADALMDAGCADEQVIAHCREPGDHLRGCWVVEFALGRE